MKHFDKTVLETVQKDIEAIERVGSMYGLIEWWAITENYGTGVSGRDQWQFVTRSHSLRSSTSQHKSKRGGASRPIFRS